MFSVVIPTQNEEKSILATLTTILQLPVDYIIPVLNGCTDKTLELVRAIPDERLHILYFPEALGIDIPRVAGMLYARRLDSKGVLFVDGDMSGAIFTNLAHLLQALEGGVDVALTNCYPYITHRAKLAEIVLKFRAKLNRELGLFQNLGLATPTHGPHALSARALALIPPEALAIPPLSLSWAKQKNLRIQVATSIRHEDLRSPRKHRRHARLIAETIIGDCVMAIRHSQNQPPTRSLGHHKLWGYHPKRRFDLLSQWQNALEHDSSAVYSHLYSLSAQILIRQKFKETTPRKYSL